MFVYALACLSLVAIGYILGANELLSGFTASLLPSIVTGVISSVIVSLFFIYKEERNKAKIAAPKLNRLLTVFRIYYTEYMLTPHIKPDIVGFKGYCEDAFEYLPNKNDISFRQLYERSRYTSLHHILSFGSKHEQVGCLSGLEEHPHLDTFLYITNVKIKELIIELEKYAHCLDKDVLAILFDLQNSLYISLYESYSTPSSGTWNQMLELYKDIDTYGEGAILDSKVIVNVKYSPNKIRADIFHHIDDSFAYYFDKMSLLQLVYDKKYKEYC